MPFVEYLCLDSNNVGPEGATALGSEMQYLTELHYFNISCNNVTPSGACTLACGGIAHCTKQNRLLMSNTAASYLSANNCT